jgi:hypothetical protein
MRGSTTSRSTIGELAGETATSEATGEAIDGTAAIMAKSPTMLEVNFWFVLGAVDTTQYTHRVWR